MQTKEDDFMKIIVKQQAINSELHMRLSLAEDSILRIQKAILLMKGKYE